MSVAGRPKANGVDDRCDLLCLDLPRAEELRAKLMRGEATEHAAACARALADPTRVAVASVLRQGGELCVCDVSWILGRSQGLTSHHLRALRNAGLAQSRRDGKMVMYSLTEDGAALVDAVVGVSEVRA